MSERVGPIAAPSAIALFVILGLAQTGRPTPLAVGGAMLAVLVSVGLAVRATRGWPLVVGLVVVAAGITAVCSGSSANLGWFGLCVLAGWGALTATTTQATVLAAVLVAGLGVEWIAVHGDAGGGAWIAGTLFAAVVCALARRQRSLIDQLHEAQAGLAMRTRAEERARIAGELHDVIGHALTVSILHVTSARLAIDEDLEEARAALSEAERLCRQSLGEVRQSVGILRENAGRSVPLPDATQLPELVESFRRAGRSVDLEIVGSLDTLTTTSGLTVFRIAQEALTNVVRHAPTAAARVCLEVTANGATLVVDNDGAAAAAGGGQPGVGILNMRERAESVGGQLSAGPTATGWRVEAELPGSRRVLT